MPESPADEFDPNLFLANKAYGDLLPYAARHVSQELPTEVVRRVEHFRQEFESTDLNFESSGTHVFTYYAPLPADSAVVTAGNTGVELDQSRFSYSDILAHFVRAANALIPKCSVILVTSREAEVGEGLKGVQVVRLNVDTSSPMLERAYVMNAYVKSSLFTANTFFLDSDAIINGPIQDVFDRKFDVGLTFREDPYLMPINEGVVLASGANKSAVKNFFDFYLGTYTSLVTDAEIAERFGSEFSNLKKWRGGQLSLNAVVADQFARHLNPDKDARGYLSQLEFLHCDEYNFSPDARAYSDSELGAKKVIHLKGNLKEHLSVIVNLQARLGRVK